MLAYGQIVDFARESGISDFEPLRVFARRIEEATVAACAPAATMAEPSADPDVHEAIRLLGLMFDGYENGTPCHEEGGHYIGPAFHLDENSFDQICNLLNRRKPPRYDVRPDGLVVPAAQQQAEPGPDGLVALPEKMPASIYRHATLGDLFDRLAVHKYAAGYALACLAAQAGERAAVRFAGIVFEAHRNDGYPGDLDGDYLQRVALDCGLLEEREVTESCGANCSCADVGEFPAICYFNTQAAKVAMDVADAPTQQQRGQ